MKAKIYQNHEDWCWFYNAKNNVWRIECSSGRFLNSAHSSQAIKFHSINAPGNVTPAMNASDGKEQSGQIFLIEQATTTCSQNELNIVHRAESFPLEHKETCDMRLTVLTYYILVHHAHIQRTQTLTKIM